MQATSHTTHLLLQRTPASPSNKAQRLIRLPARSQQCEAQCQRICTVAHYVTGDEDEDEDEDGDEEERMSERKREGDSEAMTLLCHHL